MNLLLTAGYFCASWLGPANAGEDVAAMRSEHWKQVLAEERRLGDGDADRGRACKIVAKRLRRETWKKIRSDQHNDELWRFALELDDAAEAEDLAKHVAQLRHYHKKSTLHAYGAALLASRELDAAQDSVEEDAILTRFDDEFPDGYLEQGKLRTQAAGLALRRLELDRVEELYAQALALPRSKREREQEERDYRYREWWRSAQRSVDLYRQDWSQLGGVDLDGNELRAADFRGQVLIIEYWASW